ncbi:Transferase [Trema orientale]|uniref:Transferase n=1 Tax=Trema orientale TaxID=63057 RepID=A0A2P5DE81_TREOI|nr:Transferase [Trema orientale]
MKVELEIVSKEMIQPSSPAPHHLRSYQLSFLDQIAPQVYNPFVMFYKPEKDSEFDENTTFIECNDEGIPYLEARVNCKLSHFLQNPNPNELNKLIPFESDKLADVPLGVQVNIFECGYWIMHFSQGCRRFIIFHVPQELWAAIARGDHMDGGAPRISSISGFDRVGITTKDTIISKRFVFNAAMIEDLEGKYAIVNSKGSSNHENQKVPSRVEALSAFIWSDVASRLQLMWSAVNLRPRIEPPLEEHSFGNLYRFATIIPCLDTGGDEQSGIVKRMRDQISRIDKEYVRILQEGTEHLDFIMELISAKVTIFLSFSSWCRFPLYESDFGWGRPIWGDCRP